MRTKNSSIRRVKISERLTALAGSETPLRELAGNLSKVAKSAIDEANSLSLERVNIDLERLPKNLDGFKIIHLSDIHHSPFTNIEHIKRAVKIANAKLAEGGEEVDFYKAKIATARFFFDRILPQATACFLAIKSGKGSMMALGEDAF